MPVIQEKFERLRKQAEQLVKNRPTAYSEPPPEMIEIIHELRIHQAELEVQNEELMLSQRELSQLHQGYENLYEFAPCGYLTLNGKGIISKVNRSAVKMLGKRRTRLLGSGFTRFIAGDWQDAYLTALRASKEKGERQSIELALENASGTPLWVRLDIETGPDLSEDATRWRIVLVDLTSKKAAEEALQTSERRYHQLFDTMQEGFALVQVIFDASGKPCDYHILEINQAAGRIIGIEPKTAKGRSALHFFPEPDPEWIELLNNVALSRKSARFEKFSRILNKWIFFYAFCPERGKLACIFSDISERIQTEQALRQSRADLDRAQEVGQIGSWRMDIINNVLSWSTQNYRIFGVPEGTPLTYETFLDMVYPEDRRDVDAQWRACLAGKPYDIEHRIVVDGQVKWVREKAYLEFDDEGRMQGGFGITQDITENRRMQESLRRINETLEQKVASRTRLAEARAAQLQALAVELIEAEERERRRMAELLHDDLQQILACAWMHLQSAGEKLPPEPLLAKVEGMLKDSIAKTRHLSHELSPAVLYQTDLVPALQWLVRQLMEQFDFSVEIESDCSQKMENDPLKLFIFRAVQELLFNAVKHAGVKNARVAITHTDGSLDIRVSDRGRGFDPDILENSPIKAGLGLMSLRERASYIGAKLAIESAPGQGSRFTLTVPLRLDRGLYPLQSEPTADPGTVHKAECRTGGDQADARLLLVEDHAVMRQGLVKLIADQPGLQVVGEATNGREAIELVRRLKPDLVVMDISMPEMDGIEATRHIKNRWPEVRVIGLSMNLDEYVAQDMRRAGADNLVSKTDSSADLLKAIYGMARPGQIDCG